MPLYICGFLLLGASFQKHLNVGALVMGWGIAIVAVMVNTVAICETLLYFQSSSTHTRIIDAYCNDCFPKMRVRVTLTLI